MTNQLTEVAEKKGLGGSKAKELIENFSEFFDTATKIESMAMGITVTDESQKGDIAKAREMRLKLQKIRGKTEEKRKELKEQSLREGKAIDGVANIIKALIVPAEKHLEAQEKFVENIELERKRQLFETRTGLLGKYVEDMSGYNLAEMTDEVFDKVLDSSRIAHETQKAAEKKVEDERVAKEKADAAEAERIRKENVQLKKEADAREEKIRQEKVAQKKIDDEREERSRKETAERLRINNENAAKQKKIDAEKEAKLQEERDRLAAGQKKIDDEKAEIEVAKAKEAVARAKAEAGEQKILDDKAAEEKAARMAPDKDKLLEYAKRIRSVETAFCASPAAAALAINFQKQLSEIAADLENQVKRL